MHYHLIGICGTAMASLAGMLQARGHRVTGSNENVYPPMSTLLTELVAVAWPTVPSGDNVLVLCELVLP